MTNYYVLLQTGNFLNISSDKRTEARKLAKFVGGQVLTGEQRNQRGRR